MNPTQYAKHQIAGLGEILWDCFPGASRLGGAPTNFACHCDQLGADAFPVSCIGNDDLGTQTLNELSNRGISSTYISQTPNYPTGKVIVTLDQNGKPKYDILDNVAWDHLTSSAILTKLASSLDAVCFGALSQRSPQSRETIQAFIRQMPTQSLKIFDVNLREPFYNKEIISQSLELASILKLSDDELPVLADYFNLTGNNVEQLSTLRTQFNLRLIAFTQGSKGSILLSPTETIESPSEKIEVVDSVGAGDSYTSALCIGLLKGWHLSQVSNFANKVAAYVCSQKGATPALPHELKRNEVYS